LEEVLLNSVSSKAENQPSCRKIITDFKDAITIKHVTAKPPLDINPKNVVPQPKSTASKAAEAGINWLDMVR
jgi:hypothetical protein